MSRYLKATAAGAACLLTIAALATAGAYLAISRAAQGSLFDDVAAVPANPVGLVLGTSRLLPEGRENPYFTYRIQAATELFLAGKVDYLLLSGHNPSRYYNEPIDMREALLARGIPADRIYLDYAGRRTLDSVVRADRIFGQRRFTVISQPFHNERAVFIARHQGIDAVGFNAADVDGAGGLRTKLRELAARVRTVLDLFVLDTGPRFLGDPVSIGPVAPPQAAGPSPETDVLRPRP